MNLKPELKLLVDAYIGEVCLNLPKKMRADIAAEIRSLILDAIEGRSQAGGVDPDEDMLLAVLKELGPPTQMATSYFPHTYVIGPRMYAPFWLTVRGSLIFMAVFYLLIGIGFAFGEAVPSPLAFLRSWWELFGDFLVSALQTFGVIVLVFIVLERTVPDSDWVGQVRAWGAISQIPIFRDLFGRGAYIGDWDPTSLVTVPESERVERSSTIFEIAFIILVMVLFNFIPHKVGVFGIMNGQSWFVPLLAPTFSGYLPSWDLYWLLVLGLNFILLAAGQWTRLSRWLQLGLMVVSGVLVYWMLVGPPVLGLTPGYLDLNNTSAAAVQLAEDTVIPILTTLFSIGLVFHLIAKAVHLLIRLIRLMRRSSAPVWKPADGEAG